MGCLKVRLYRMASCVSEPTKQGHFGQFPNMPCMKRVYRDKIGVGTPVCSQERRALFVPLINRWSTADFVPPSVLSTN